MVILSDRHGRPTDLYVGVHVRWEGLEEGRVEGGFKCVESQGGMGRVEGERVERNLS